MCVRFPNWAHCKPFLFYSSLYLCLHLVLFSLMPNFNAPSCRGRGKERIVWASSCDAAPRSTESRGRTENSYAWHPRTRHRKRGEATHIQRRTRERGNKRCTQLRACVQCSTQEKQGCSQVVPEDKRGENTLLGLIHPTWGLICVQRRD